MLVFKSKSADENDVIEKMKSMADQYGLWEEVKRDYDHNISRGMSPMNAAFDALYEWDVCDYEPNTKEEENDSKSNDSI